MNLLKYLLQYFSNYINQIIFSTIKSQTSFSSVLCFTLLTYLCYLLNCEAIRKLTCLGQGKYFSSLAVSALTYFLRDFYSFLLLLVSSVRLFPHNSTSFYLPIHSVSWNQYCIALVSVLYFFRTQFLQKFQLHKHFKHTS